MSYTDEVGKKLNALIEKNYDAEAGYKLAQEEVENPALKKFFEKQQKSRYEFGHDLKAELKSFGQEPDKGTSVAGDLHRAWMNIKSTISSNSAESILEEAIRGEKAAVEEYEEILKDSEVPASTGNVLMKQKNAIVASLNEVKALEDIA